MKFALIVILVVVIMLIAISVSRQYKDKYEFFDNLKQFLNKFKMNVSFKQETIEDFLINLKPQKQFSVFIKDYKEYLVNGNINLNNIKILTQEEQEELKDMLISLGKFDAANELNQIDVFCKLIDEKLTKAEVDKNKLCPMIVKLSFLLALGIGILLI